MHDNNDIEKVFEETPKPSVVNGSHRLHLKHALLQEMKKENVPMRSWKKTLVWAACFVMILAISGFAAQKIYKRYTVREEPVIVISEKDGKMQYTVINEFTIQPLDLDTKSENAEEICSEIEDLILDGKYTLVEDTKKTGENQSYLYTIILASGDSHTVETNRPLEDIIGKYGKDIKVGDLQLGTNTIELENGESINVYTAPADSVLEK